MQNGCALSTREGVELSVEGFASTAGRLHLPWTTRGGRVWARFGGKKGSPRWGRVLSDPDIKLDRGPGGQNSAQHIKD